MLNSLNHKIKLVKSAFGGKKLLYILLTFHFSLLTSFCFSQNPDIKRTWNWYFGEYAGLNFSGGNPVALTNGAMNAFYSTSSISDTAGNLLFYTDGRSVWNRNHLMMPNGTNSLHGSLNIGAQPCLIVPQPLSSNYYIFTIWANPDSARFKYSIVDMSLNAGFGDVAQKNIFLTDKPNGKITATKHKNDTGIWVINTDTFSNRFRAYLLTPSGLQPPVISYAGRKDNYFTGAMKVSPDGKRIAVAINIDGSEILDFDNSTGIVSNPIYLPPCVNNCDYGVDFSPDNSKIYFTRFKAPPSPAWWIAQVDLSSNDSLTIVNSYTLVYTIPNLPGAVQLASDGKVYFTQGANTIKRYLSAIMNPNAAGPASNVVDSVAWLGGKRCYDGLPNFVTSYFYDSTLVTVTPAPDLQKDIICYPNPFNYTTNIIIPSPLIVTEIVMMDLLGRKTEIKKKITKENAQTIVTLERNNLPPGIYFLQIKTNNNTYSQKLIITN